MKQQTKLFLLLVIILGSCSSEKYDGTLKKNTTNSHYLEFRGKSVILMGSTEHYGAILNLDFDYIKYLDELYNSGLNLTRTFSGIYVEKEGVFGIENNTLAPASGRYINPFARSNEPGYANGGNRFDLSQWDVNYFERLKDFISQADKRDIIVEITLFSSIYEESNWDYHPLNPKNNINKLPDVHYTEIQTLNHPEYLEIQERMVKKIVKELNQFDNIYYEVCNEPYADPVPLDWHHHMATLIKQTEKSLSKNHIISWNYENNSGFIENLPKEYSLVNFHYAEPKAVIQNRHLNLAIGDNETGFKGTADWPYRVEAWAFLLAGGALFNHLDYSFTAGHEKGDFIYPLSQPGGGNEILRRQLGFLKKFLEEKDVFNMVTDTIFVNKTSNPELSTQVLALSNQQYIVYFYKKWTLPNENISIRFSGDFHVPSSEVYTFITESDDGIRIWVNNSLIIDNWTDHASVKDTGEILLKKGEIVPLKIEYYNGLYGGSIGINWNTETISETILGTTYTFVPGSNSKGLLAEYYKDVNLERFVKSDTIGYINHLVQDFNVTGSGFTDLSCTVETELPNGKFEIVWLDPKNGEILYSKDIDHAGGMITFDSGTFDYDALLIVQKR